MSDNAKIVAQPHPFITSDRIIKEYPEGTTIGEVLREIQPSGTPKIYVNEEPCTDIAYSLRAGDRVVIKSIPQGEGARTTLIGVAGFALALVGIATGFVPLIALGFSLVLGVTIFGTADSLYDTFKGLKNKYSVSGGSNGEDKWEDKWGKVPAVFGKFRFAPPYAVRPYTSLSGTDGETITLHMIY